MVFSTLEKKASRVISILLHPIVIPSLFILYILFAPGIISLVIPVKYKWLLTTLIFIMTIIIPLIIIMGLRWLNIIGGEGIPEKLSRSYSYIIVMICYFFAWRMLIYMGFNNEITFSMLTVITILFIAIIINMGWNISTHGAGWGCFSGIIAALTGLGITSGMAFLLVSIPAFGIAGTSQIILHKNTPSQVYAGYAVGFTIAFIMIIFFNGMV